MEFGRMNCNDYQQVPPSQKMWFCYTFFLHCCILYSRPRVYSDDLTTNFISTRRWEAYETIKSHVFWRTTISNTGLFVFILWIFSCSESKWGHAFEAMKRSHHISYHRQYCWIKHRRVVFNLMYVFPLLMPFTWIWTILKFEMKIVHLCI